LRRRSGGYPGRQRSRGLAVEQGRACLFRVTTRAGPKARLNAEATGPSCVWWLGRDAQCWQQLAAVAAVDVKKAAAQQAVRAGKIRLVGVSWCGLDHTGRPASAGKARGKRAVEGFRRSGSSGQKAGDRGRWGAMLVPGLAPGGLGSGLGVFLRGGEGGRHWALLSRRKGLFQSARQRVHARLEEFDLQAVGE